MKLTKGGQALYMHCLPADVTGVSCKAGEVSAAVFERYRLADVPRGGPQAVRDRRDDPRHAVRRPGRRAARLPGAEPRRGGEAEARQMTAWLGHAWRHGIAVQGLLLFLFIPLVLFLFLRQPLGPGWSVAVGVAIMLGHRFVAAPWMAKFADVRCLWCGRVGARGPGRRCRRGGRTLDDERVLRGARRRGWRASWSFVDALPRRHRGRHLPAAGVAARRLARRRRPAGRCSLTHVNASIFRVVVAVTV